MADKALPSEGQQQEEADHRGRKHQRKRKYPVNPGAQAAVHLHHYSGCKHSQKESGNRGGACSGQRNVQRR